MPRKVTSKSTRSELTDRAAQLSEFFNADPDGWGQGAAVLERVRAVPTMWPQINLASRIGGWPIQRIGLIHGPSAHGKTSFSHGLGLSFLQRGHIYGFIDAELTTPESWLQTLMDQQSRNPAFRAMRPTSYEQAALGVRKLCESVIEGREAGKLPADTAGVIVVDSLRKLQPERLLAKLEKEEGGIDGASGRAAQMKAAINAQWMDELAPLAYKANFGIVLISREYDRSNPQPGQEQFVVAGGKAVNFDSSLTARIVRSEWVHDGSGDNKRVVGERHAVQIRKSKIGALDGKITTTYFHTSNGTLTPEGFDLPRDLLEMAEEIGAIKKDGAWYSYKGERIGQGASQVVKRLHEDAALLGELRVACETGEVPEKAEG